MAVLGARSARKIVNLCHFKRFPRPLGLACCACVEHACVRVGGVWSRCQGPDPTIPYPLKTSNPRTDRPTRRRQEEISICVSQDFLCYPLLQQRFTDSRVASLSGRCSHIEGFRRTRGGRIPIRPPTHTENTRRRRGGRWDARERGDARHKIGPLKVDVRSFRRRRSGHRGTGVGSASR